MEFAACYIVRNEAKELDKSIHSLINAVDELVVVDTGSEDATIDIARSYRARIFSFPWQNHFAKARNFALSKVKSPWIIFLDADEYFLHPKRIRPALLDLLEGQPDADAVMLVRHNIDTGREENHLPYDVSLRILRNAPELRYRGRIHEMLQKNGDTPNLLYAGEGLSLVHTGYSSEVNKRKIRRNLALLNAEIAEEGKTPSHDMYLSDCYFSLGDYRGALLHAMEALCSDLLVISDQGSLYHIAIESMRQLNMPPEYMLALARAAIQDLPDLPEFYGEQGMILCGMGRLEKARRSLETAMDIYDRGKVNYRQGSYFTDSVAAIVCKRLGEIHRIRRDAESCQHWLKRALELDKKNPEIQALCRDFRKQFPQNPL